MAANKNSFGEETPEFALVFVSVCGRVFYLVMMSFSFDTLCLKVSHVTGSQNCGGFFFLLFFF